MPWVIGIDETGYGPNLGPFVMTSVACRVPEGLADADLWHVLKAAVRRHPSADDGRILIEDSKVVYSPNRGLHGLELGVTATLSPWCGCEAVPFGRFLEWLCPAHLPDPALERWYTGQSLLPVVAPPADCIAAGARLERCCRRKQVDRGLPHSVVIYPRRFNELLDQWGSKGAVLGQGLAELIHSNLDLEHDTEPLSFFVDKHGGRNNYSALLQNAFPGGMVVAEAEGMARSVYRVLGLGRDIRLTIQPRADAEYLCVALASMVSKYVRELFMLEFNRFWQAEVPGLRPTAGYPGDAPRYFEAIRAAADRLGLPEVALWRRK